MTATLPHRVAGLTADDLENRWQPSAQSVLLAQRVLDLATSASEHTVALVPMFMPGKTFGIWTVGQQVQTVPHAVFLLDERDPNTRGNRYAVEGAARAAATAAGITTGTYGHATIWPDGEWSVSEDGRI